MNEYNDNFMAMYLDPHGMPRCHAIGEELQSVIDYAYEMLKAYLDYGSYTARMYPNVAYFQLKVYDLRTPGIEVDITDTIRS